MRHGSYPPVAIAATFDHTNTAVRHPNAPFEIIVIVIRQINAVHHFPLVAVNVFVAQAADVIHLCHCCTAILVYAPVPGILVHAIVHDTIRNATADAARLRIADSVPYATLCRAARRAVVRVLSRSALFLSVPTPVAGEEQVGNA